MDRTDAEILMAARDLISDPTHWTVGTRAVDSSGQHVRAYQPEAVKFCARGAIEAVVGDCSNLALSQLHQYNRCQDILAHASFPLSIFWTNDKIGHPAVMEMFDNAIRIAKEEQE